MRRWILILVVVPFLLSACVEEKSVSTKKEMQQQEVLMSEALSQTGMPNIKNFRERKMLKEILELRDQQGLVTYTYVFNELNGKLVFLGQSVGYGIPYATQYTNPQMRNESRFDSTHIIALPQPDPNGLYSPQSAEGTWILLLDPNGSGKVSPVYVEPRVIVSPFKLRTD
jgi:hypothetical protein